MAVIYDLSLKGKCKEFAERLKQDNPNFRLIRGYYHCLIEGKQPHWWCIDEKGAIIDPTIGQFQSLGKGNYEEFDGLFECSFCKIKITEDKIFKAANTRCWCSRNCYRLDCHDPATTVGLVVGVNS